MEYCDMDYSDSYFSDTAIDSDDTDDAEISIRHQIDTLII